MSKPVSCWKKFRCIYGVLARSSAGALLGATTAFAAVQEMASTSSISITTKPIFSIGIILYAAITGNTNAVWGAGIGAEIGAGIGAIVGGYYGAKQNEPIEALKNVDKKVSDFLSETAAEIVNFVKACNAPEEAEQSPETV